MLNTTFITATGLKTTLDYLNVIKAELALPDTQKVIVLKKRPQPSAPPAALTTSLADMESFLLAQAVAEVQSQIDALQDEFDALQDPES